MKLFNKISDLSEDTKFAIIYIFLAIFFIPFFIGLCKSDKPDICTIKKPIEVMVLVPLFLGCQLGQDKFELKLN